MFVIRVNLSNTFYYHGDHLGSSNYITDREGEVFEHMEYMPYGETWIEEGNDNQKFLNYLFTSKEFDSETGLYYFGARYLDPVTSRWMSCDPIYDGVKDGLGLYTYCRNNPVVYYDPNGKEKKHGMFIFFKAPNIKNPTGHVIGGLGDESNFILFDVSPTQQGYAEISEKPFKVPFNKGVSAVYRRLEIINNFVSFMNDADAVLYIELTSEQIDKLNKFVKDFQNARKGDKGDGTGSNPVMYNAITNSCTTILTETLKLLYPDIDAEEYLMPNGLGKMYMKFWKLEKVKLNTPKGLWKFCNTKNFEEIKDNNKMDKSRTMAILTINQYVFKWINRKLEKNNQSK